MFSTSLGLDFSNIFLLLALLVGLVYVYKKKSRCVYSKPIPKGCISFEELPTPKGYPILGHLTKLGALPHVTITNWSNQLGPLYRIRMGLQNVLVVSNIKTIRNALLKHSTAFAGRPQIETLKEPNEQGADSLAFSNFSPEWLYEKGIAKAAISLYTTGKDPTKRSVMETSSYKHANSLVDELLKEAKEKNNIVDPGSHIFANVTNVVSKICFGEEFELDDPKFIKLIELHKEFDRALGVSQMANLWPLLKYLPVVSRSFQNQKKFMIHRISLTKSFMKTHLESYDDNNMRDLLDSLFHERKKLRKNVNDDSDTKLKTDLNFDYKTRMKIIGSINSIFGAGFDTTYTMIYWAILYLAVFPETQTKIREEIENVMPPDEQPSFRLHAGRCHYTVAWIYELIRHVSPMPFLLPHATTQEVDFENCFLPKGLSVYFNIHQVHYDSNLWDNPQQFYPNRFLDVDTQCFKPNLAANVLAWGMGKRFCPGKDLSKHEMFIFITVLVRRLQIKPSIPGVEPVLNWPVELGISTKPKDFKVEVLEK